MYICVYMCIYMCGVLWDLFCPQLCCPRASIIRSFWDQGLVRSGAADGLAVGVYVTVNNINMGVI